MLKHQIWKWQRWIVLWVKVKNLRTCLTLCQLKFWDKKMNKNNLVKSAKTTLIKAWSKLIFMISVSLNQRTRKQWCNLVVNQVITPSFFTLTILLKKIFLSKMDVIRELLHRWLKMPSSSTKIKNWRGNNLWRALLLTFLRGLSN